MFFKKLNIIKILILFVVSLVVPIEYLKNDGEITEASEVRPVEVDLNEIRERGKLVAITDYNSTNYFIYKGEPMGFQYELLKRAAHHLDLDLEVIVTRDFDAVFTDLQKGNGDIIASNFAITADRLKLMDFTDPLMLTRQVLVQLKPEGWRQMKEHEIEKILVRNPIDLPGKKIYIRRNTSYYERLMHLSKEIGAGLNIIEAPSDSDTEDLVTLVAKGEIPYTIADENIAMACKTYHPDLDIKTPISFPQKIGWAVRKTSPELLQQLNDWLLSFKNSKDYNVIYNKYFRSRKAMLERNESDLFSVKGGKISPYDALIKIYGNKIGWDWRLLASLMYQESQFDPHVKSWAGAFGLMQLIPSTAEQYGVDSLSSPEEHISAGTQYLAWIDNFWKERIEDDKERIKFTLASYNVGLGHIIDARKLAEKYGLDPDKWDGSVSYYLLQKVKPKYYNDPVVKHGYCRGQEPFYYVKEILERYDHYRNVISEMTL